MTGSSSSPAESRWISLGLGTAPVPERLLLAHARGQVLFITGAGTSLSSGLPDFRALVLNAYEKLDAGVHGVLKTIPRDQTTIPTSATSTLSYKQTAEARRFAEGQYDVVLGMLERRMDGPSAATNNVRKKLFEILRSVPDGSGGFRSPKPAPIHRSLMRLAERGGVTTIVTTNFDLLLEAASARKGKRSRSFSLGGIPRPGRNQDFSGVLHIHGALTRNAVDPSDVIVTDQDFGEFYLRRRTVPDFIYDAARLFHLVLVGYSANDAPMRYLLNAVAADGSRFDDLKERFAFVAMPPSTDDVLIEDWKGRGITPIPYDSTSNHVALAETLGRWANLSVTGTNTKVDALVRKLVKLARPKASDSDRDLFDHIFRRGSDAERLRLTKLVSTAGADVTWLTAMTDIEGESR